MYDLHLIINCFFSIAALLLGSDNRSVTSLNYDLNYLIAVTHFAVKLESFRSRIVVIINSFRWLLSHVRTYFFLVDCQSGDNIAQEHRSVTFFALVEI